MLFHTLVSVFSGPLKNWLEKLGTQRSIKCIVLLLWHCWSGTTLKGKHWFCKLSANSKAMLKIFPHIQVLPSALGLYFRFAFVVDLDSKEHLCAFNVTSSITFLKLLLFTECKEALWLSSFLAWQIASQGQNRSMFPAALCFSEMTPGKDFFSSEQCEQQVFLWVITLDSDVSSTRVPTGQSKWQDRQKWISGVSSQSELHTSTLVF